MLFLKFFGKTTSATFFKETHYRIIFERQPKLTKTKSIDTITN